jgi:predicted ATPase/DNA-binding SARP family transcriptional activator
MQTHLVIRLFGMFEAELNGLPLPRTRTRKEQWLLTLLLLKHKQPVDRDWLAGVLWPDSTEKQALHNLRRSLANLRDVLGAQAARLTSPSPRALRLDVSHASVDVLEFDAVIAHGDSASLEEAVRLYRGPLLEGCEEAWVFPERDHREQAYLCALERLAERAEPVQAIYYLRRLLAIEPLRETALCALMVALSATGDRAGALKAYRDFRLLLHDHLQTTPGADTQALYQRLCAMNRSTSSEPALRRQNQEVPARSFRPPVHLPVPISPLIGREEDLAKVARLLAASRLVTLVGAGGVGKTCLAIAVSELVAATFPDGVWFIDLAPLSDPSQVEETLLAALNLRGKPGQTLEMTLEEFLSEKRALLLLDNCEHLLETCAALIISLLARLPDLHMLATSRQALGIAGEQVWRVPSLSFADPATALTGDLSALLQQYASSRLFLTRAEAASDSFVLTAQNARAILKICARLDGIPLALELAVARITTLSVEQIAERLENVLPLLAAGVRSALPRHKTLRALIDWSYALLTDAQQQAFRQLTCFVGGWSLEATEALLGEEALDLLAALIAQSLLIMEVDAEGRARYRMLETLRQYGQEKLRAAGEWKRVRTFHRSYFCGQAREIHPKLQSPEQSSAMQRLLTDYDNFRLALKECLEEMEAPQDNAAALPAENRRESVPATEALQLATLLSRVWLMRGNVQEGSAQLSALLTHPQTQQPSIARAGALNVAGLHARMMSNYAEAYALFEQALAIFREFNDVVNVATALGNMAIVRSRQGDFEAEYRLHTESLALHRSTGNRWGTALVLANLGALARKQGDFRQASSLLAESLALHRDLENRPGIAQVLCNLGTLSYAQADYTAARRYQEESLALRRALGDKIGIADSLNDLSQIALDQGDYTSARDLLEESLTLRIEIGDRSGTALVLGNLGTVVLEQGDYPRARMLQEESLALRRRLGDKEGIALSLANLGDLAYCEGDHTLALALHSESLELFRAQRNRRGTSYLLLNQGIDLHRLQRLQEAFDSLSECLQLSCEINNRRVLLQALEGLAALALTQGQPEHAAELFGTADQMRRTFNLARSIREQQEYDLEQAKLSALLPATVMEKADVRSKPASLEQAISLAMKYNPYSKPSPTIFPVLKKENSPSN